METRVSSKWSRGRSVVATLVAGAFIATSLIVAPAAHAAGSVLLEETFTEASVSDARAIGLRDACLIAAPADTTPPVGESNLSDCVAHQIGVPAAGTSPGWLQLTDVEFRRTGGMVFNRALPSTAGLSIEFDQAQFGGTGADGIGFFLSDGSRELTDTGAFGGSLGYGQGVGGTQPGVAGGYLGVGFDSWGNFIWGNEGLGVDGCAVQSPFTDRVPNTVTLRGPGEGLSGYCFLTTTASPGGGSTLPGSLRVASPASPDDAVRNARVTVSPGTFPTITVEIDFTGTRTAYQTVLTYTMTDPAPPTYKFGFSASTGGAYDAHLIRNVRIMSIEDLGDINLVKQVDRTTPQPAAYGLGDTIPYQFVVTNTGVEALTGVVVDDPLIDDVSCPSTVLGPAGGADSSMVCTGTHTVTAEDAQHTTFVNTATVVGLNSVGEQVTDNSSATVDITVAHASLALEKIAVLNDGNGNDLAEPGETITYSFAVTNTGTVTLTDPVVDDPRAGSVTCPVSIAPGATVTCTADADYTVTEADVLAGGVVNTATASATPPPGIDPPDPVEDTVTVPTAIPDAALALEKIANLAEADGDGIAEIGDVISYEFLLTNVGNVTLDDVGVSDPTIGAVTCEATTLAIGESTTCTASATHVVTEADILAGAVTNTATGVATPPVNVGFIPPVDTAIVPTVEASAGLAIVKDAVLDDTNGNGLADIGELIAYSFEVMNTGTVTVSGITVVDPLAGSVTCPATSLAGGASMTCTADAPYTVTEADVLAGGVVNTATADGTVPDGVDPFEPPTDTTTTPTDFPTAGIEMVKRASLNDANGNGLADVGETIDYGFQVRNTGNVTLDPVTIDDPMIGAVTCDSESLPPATTMNCTGQAYTVTTEDITRGSIVNVAVANGTPPDGVATPPPSESTVTVPTVPAPPVPPGGGGSGLAVTGAALGGGLTLAALLLALGAALRAADRISRKESLLSAKG